MIFDEVINRVGSVTRGADCFGRERFLVLFWQKILNGSVLLAAPRRFGKTSVLFKLIDEPHEKVKVIHTDVEAVTEPTEMIILLIEELSKDESFEKSVGKIGFVKKGWNFFQKNFEEVDLHFAKVKLRDEIREDWQAKGKEIFLKVAESDGLVVFVLDEFPMMLDSMLRDNRKDDAKKLLHWFRSLRQSPELQHKIRFVIAGSIGIDRILNDLEEIASINDFEKLKLEPFSTKTAKDFLTALCKTKGLVLDQTIHAKILEVIGIPIPYFIQIMFSEIEKAYSQEDEEITIELIEKLYKNKVLGSDCKSYFEHYYSRLSSYYKKNEEKAAKNILKDISISGELKQDTCFQIYQKAVGKQADMQRFSGLMTELENDFYITFNFDEKTYEFGSKLLRDWWLRHYGLTM